MTGSSEAVPPIDPGTPLVLVDFQTGFDDDRWGDRTDHDADDAAARLLRAWRDVEWPVAHVRHDSTEADSPLRRDAAGFEYRPDVAPRDSERSASVEAEFVKRVNGAFLDEEFANWIADRSTDGFVLCGYTTDHCVSTTARMGGNRGYDVTIVADACATFDRSYDGEQFDADTVHRTALSHLDGEFATVTTTAAVLDGLSAVGNR